MRNKVSVSGILLTFLAPFAVLNPLTVQPQFTVKSQLDVLQRIHIFLHKEGFPYMRNFTKKWWMFDQSRSIFPCFLGLSLTFPFIPGVPKRGVTACIKKEVDDNQLTAPFSSIFYLTSFISVVSQYSLSCPSTIFESHGEFKWYEIDAFIL